MGKTNAIKEKQRNTAIHLLTQRRKILSTAGERRKEYRDLQRRKILGTAKERRKEYRDLQRRKIWVQLDGGGKSTETYKEGRFGYS